MIGKGMKKHCISGKQKSGRKIAIRWMGGVLAAVIALGTVYSGKMAFAAEVSPSLELDEATIPKPADNPEITEASSSSDSPRSTEASEQADASEVTEPLEPTQASERAEATEPTGPAVPNSTDAKEPTEAPGLTTEPETTEALELTKTPTPTPKPEKPTPALTPKPTKEPKPEEDTKPTEASEPTYDPERIPTPTPRYSVELPTESNDARYQYLLGIDAREITMSSPPPGYGSAAAAEKHMRTITVPVWKMTASGKKYASTYQLTVNEKLTKSVKAIFKEIYALDIKFPIKVLKGYYYRKVGGVGLSRSTLMSVHSFGAAIDINPGDYDNDYFLGKGNDLRDKSNPYCIPDEVIEIFEKYGWFWGGNFEIAADTMHFQYLGLEFLTYQNNSPFRTLKVKAGYMKGTDVRNLQQRLRELGYSVSVDGVYGNKTASAIKKYQKNKGLPATGEVDYKTWETIINETHYMPYAF